MNTALSRVLAKHRRRLLMACLTLVPFLAACGGAGTTIPKEHTQSAQPSPSPRYAGPLLSGTVTTAEDVTLTASFRVPIHVPANQASTQAPNLLGCAQYAAGVLGGFVAPEFDITSDDHSVYFQGMLSDGYQGPGIYHSSTQPSLSGTIAVAVGVGAGQQPAYSIFRSHINGASTLTVQNDGSGTFLFSEWGSDEVRGNTGSAASISGTVTWACR